MRQRPSSPGLVHCPPAELDLESMRKAWAAALTAGVGVSALQEAFNQLRAAEECQLPREVAIARLEKLLLVGAASSDTGALRAARLEAQELGAPERMLSRVDDALSAAARAQLLRDAATTSLLALSAPTPPTHAEVATLKALVPKAAAAGVTEGVLQMVEASLHEAEEALASSDDRAAAHRLRLLAATARTAQAAPRKRSEAERMVATTEAVVAVATEKVGECLAELKLSVRGAAWSLQQAAEVEGRVNELVRQAQQAWGAHVEAAAEAQAAAASEWGNAEAARSSAAASQVALLKLREALRDAQVADSEASWQLSKARAAVNWAEQVAEVVATAQAEAEAAPPPSPSNLVEIEPRRAPPGGSCCSRPSPSDVLDPSELHVEDTRTAGSGPGGADGPRVVDEIAWGPLWLPAASSHQIELLLAFAIGGLYSDAPICEAVAAAVCRHDPGYATSRGFVLRLAAGYVAGSVTLTAGGLATSGRVKSIWSRISPKTIKGTLTGRGSSPSVAGRGSSPSIGARSPSMSRSSSKSIAAARSRALTLTTRGKRAPSQGMRPDDLTAPPEPPMDVTAWPGRVVERAISESTFGKILECWIAHMARNGSQLRGGPPAGGDASDRGGASTRSVGFVEAAPPGAVSVVGAGGALGAVMAELLLSAQYSDLVQRAGVRYPRILTALLERHHEVTEGAAKDGMVDGDDEEALEVAAALADVHSCISLILGAAELDEMLPVWTSTSPVTNPPFALTGAARAFGTQLFEHEPTYKPMASGGTPTDASYERVVLVLVNLFVLRPASLTGFQQLVPRVFDVYLAKGTQVSLLLRLHDAPHTPVSEPDNDTATDAPFLPTALAAARQALRYAYRRWHRAFAHFTHRHRRRARPPTLFLVRARNEAVWQAPRRERARAAQRAPSRGTRAATDHPRRLSRGSHHLSRQGRV